MGTWRIPFKSDSDDQYEIHIYGMSSDKTLLPDENPFTTAHDTSEDFFLPIREGSGYIRCIGKVGDVDELYVNNSATHHVDLLFEDSVIWTGACKAEAYTQPYTPGFVSIEIPLVDTVAMLDGEYFPTSRTRPMSVDEVIFTMLEMLNVNISYLHFPYRTAPTNLRYNYLQPLNWIKPLDEPDISGNRYEIATLKEVMEDICKTYGWSLRQEGCDWYFTSLDVTDSDLHGDTYYKVEPSDFSDQRDETVSSFTNINPADTKHNMSLYQGKRSVKVEGNPFEMPSDIFELDFDNMDYIGAKNARKVLSVSRKTIRLISYGFKPSAEFGQIQSDLYSSSNNMPLYDMFMKYVNDKEDKEETQYDTGIYGIGFEAFDLSTHEQNEREEQQNPQEGMVICPGYSSFAGAKFSPNTLISTTQKDTYVFLKGTLKTIKTWADKPIDSNADLLIQVKFGNYYLQPSGSSSIWQPADEWATNPAAVVFKFIEGKPDSIAGRSYKPRWNKQLDDGACFRLPPGVSGKLEITFYVPIINNTDKYIAHVMSDFEIVARKMTNRYESTPNTNVAKAYIGNGNKEDYEVASNLTCARGSQSGYGIILSSPSSDDVYMPASSIDITYDAPEVALMNRLRAYYRTSYRVLDITLKNNAPSPLNVVSIGGRNFVPIAIERDYIRNNYKTRFIERK